MLPYRIALNVNYPAKAPADVAGVKLARQGTKSFADISFTQKQPGVYVPVSPVAQERDEFEAAETPVDAAEGPGPDARRDAVHERGRAAAEEMRGRPAE